MSRPFLITGLPRSRTAWMSVVATQPGRSMCFHEPMTWLDGWRDIFPLWARDTHAFMGISDSGLAFRLVDIIDAIDPQILIIDRDVAEVEEAVAQIGVPPSNIVRLLSAALAPFTNAGKVKRMAFDDLRYPEAVAECLIHLMPGERVDMDRLHELGHMKIETDLDRVREAMASKHAAVVDLMGPDIWAAVKLAEKRAA